MGMSPKKFEEIVTPLIKIRGKNIKSRKTITLKDDREYSLIIDCVYPIKPCDDCGSLVSNRRVYFYNARYIGSGRKTGDDWQKKCSICLKRLDFK